MLGAMAKPSTFENLVSLLQTCRRKKTFLQAKQLYEFMRHNQLDTHRVLGNYLVPTLVDCGCLPDAQIVFDGLPRRFEHSWTSLISGYLDRGDSHYAFQLYHRMLEDSISPMGSTFLALLRACTMHECVETGRCVHSHIIKEGFEKDLIVGNTLIDMYGKCGLLAEARCVFNKLPVRDGVSWNALISGYSKHGLGEEAMRCFEQMHLDPDDATEVWTVKACGNKGAVAKGPRNSYAYVALLKACTRLKDMERGRKLHAESVKKGLETDLYICNTLLDMYCKCASLEEARQIFDKLLYRNGISWNAIIAGYADHGLGDEVLKCYEQMQIVGASPDDATFVCGLKACGSLGVLELGQKMHADIVKRGLEVYLFVGNVLVDMYVKCGSLVEGQKVFDRLPLRDVASWTALIKGYGENHDPDMAVQFFEDMQEQGVKPNAITFICLLAACSHGRLVSKGQEYYKLMGRYGIEPSSDHYACMVDLLARSGHADEAIRFAQAMQPHPSSEILRALLSASKNHGEMVLGVRCFQQLV